MSFPRFKDGNGVEYAVNPAWVTHIDDTERYGAVIHIQSGATGFALTVTDSFDQTIGKLGYAATARLG